jgi:integrase
MSENLPEGIDRLASGRIRARYWCKGCSRKAHERKGQHSKTFPPKGGIRAAVAWRRAELAKVDAGTHVGESRATVGEYVRQVLENKRRVKASTRKRYDQQAAHLGRLGARPLQAVKPHEVETWVSGLSETLAPSTVRDIVGLVRSAYALAVKRGDCARSPFIEIDLPTIVKIDYVPLTAEQVEAIATAMPGRYRIGVLLQAALGLRASELLALRVTDVAFLASPCKVSITRQLGRDDDRAAGRLFTSLKTTASERTIVLDASVKMLLSEHLRRYPPEDLIMTTIHGNAVTQKVWNENFNRAVKAAAGVPVAAHPHDLRHYAASALVARGVPVTAVSRFLGHANAGEVIRTYAHVMPDADQVIAAALASVWSPPVSQRVSQPSLVEVAQGV